MKKIIFSLFSFLLTSIVFAQDERIFVQPVSGAHFQAGSFEYVFQLLDTVSHRQLVDSDLKLTHTKKLHFVAYDAALKEFRHLHPEFDGAGWKVKLDLPVDGQYLFWVQGQLLDGTEFSASTDAMLMEGQPENQVLPLGDIRSGVDKNTKITLANSKVTAGKMAMIHFVVSRVDGQTPILTPYLGAFAHVIATQINGKNLEHVHPEAGTKPNQGLLHVTFPGPGDYRLWVQLIDGGSLKTIPLSVSVSK